jgi:hypothetical protein
LFRICIFVQIRKMFTFWILFKFWKIFIFRFLFKPVNCSYFQICSYMKNVHILKFVYM